MDISKLDKESVNKITFPELIIRINELGFVRVPCYLIVKGTKIYRARPFNEIKRLNTDELSYNPWPTRIDRASTPCTPIFYGSISTSSNDFPLFTNFAELNQILRIKSKEYNEQEIIVAEFEVKEDFYAAAMIFNKEFIEKNKQYEKLYFNTKENSLQLRDSDFEIFRYFSNMFALPDISEKRDNRVTAAFTISVLGNNDMIDAVLYPSVRMHGVGTNIAIHPTIIKSTLECKRIRVMKLYIKNLCVVPDYISYSDKITNDANFQLISYQGTPKSLGKEFCLKQLEDCIKKYSHHV